MEQTNFELAMEIISQGVHELLNPDDSENDESIHHVTTFLNCAQDGYCLIQWPESQEYMEEEWFEEEAILAMGGEEKTGSSAYFIPLKRVI